MTALGYTKISLMRQDDFYSFGLWK